MKITGILFLFISGPLIAQIDAKDFTSLVTSSNSINTVDDIECIMIKSLSDKNASLTSFNKKNIFCKGEGLSQIVILNSSIYFVLRDEKNSQSIRRSLPFKNILSVEVHSSDKDTLIIYLE